MEIVSKIFEIECKKPTLDFFESWFKANNLDVVRWAIVKIDNDLVSLDVSYKLNI